MRTYTGATDWLPLIPMSQIPLTAEEVRVVQLFARLPTDIEPRLTSWLAEVLPAIGLCVLSYVRGSATYMVAAIAALLFFNTMRMFRQVKYSRLLQSICAKLEASGAVGDAPRPEDR